MELVEQLNSFTEPEGRAELKARLGAWWNGKDFDREAYLAQIAENEENQTTNGSKIKPLDVDKKISTPPPRIAALETIWGRGRYMPGDGELDAVLIEAMGRVRGRIGKIGLLGVDAVSTDILAQAAGEALELVEWREPCGKRSSELTENARVTNADLDRMNRFEDGTLKSVVSVDAMTFVDHKAGLSSRVYRALRDGGRWALMDYSANPDYVADTAFASAWAEPQLCHGEELQKTLEITGFKLVRRVDATPIVIDAVKAAFARLGPALEDVVAEGIGGRDAALMLQEVSWEVVAWRSRLKALEAGQLRVDVWIVEKPGALAEDDEPLNEAFLANETAQAVDADLFAPADEAEKGQPAEAIADIQPDDANDGIINSPSSAADDAAGWEVEVDEEEATEELDQSAVDSLFD
ncbi:hypothetical protein [Hirschia litorea]|uniref:Methyltransferase domain-containing protein n=1 Tax=Hirschia litorea TaxID=1199156 RepID=A0ABW2IG85_9PROT